MFMMMLDTIYARCDAFRNGVRRFIERQDWFISRLHEIIFGSGPEQQHQNKTIHIYIKYYATKGERTVPFSMFTISYMATWLLRV